LKNLKIGRNNRKIMLRKLFYIFLFTLLLSNKFPLYSQSPLTNINFYKGYNDFGVVAYAEKTGYLDYKIAQELMKPNLSSDVKAAIINALSFEILGKDNAERFISYLKMKYHFINFNEFIDSLSADEIFCYAYLVVMDDYFEPEASFPFFEKALKKDPNSFTYQMIFSMVMAQSVFLYDRCKAWKLVDSVMIDPSLRGLMLPEAINLIVSYMKVYSDDCR